MGWQRQHHGVTVQGEIERAAARVADESVELVCAGRTDTGVHAVGQVAHFDTGAERSTRGWVLGINAHLPPDISVTWACRVAADFHARFSATARRYLYLIYTSAARSALVHGRAWQQSRPLEIDAMRAATRPLLGEHDFSSLRAAGCQAKSATRTITRLGVSCDGAWVVVDVTANAFLQHMVRNLVGLLVTVGRGELAAADVPALIAARDRRTMPFAVPADGLYLASVTYPASYALPGRDVDPRRLLPIAGAAR